MNNPIDGRSIARVLRQEYFLKVLNTKTGRIFLLEYGETECKLWHNGKIDGTVKTKYLARSLKAWGLLAYVFETLTTD